MMTARELRRKLGTRKARKAMRLAFEQYNRYARKGKTPKDLPTAYRHRRQERYAQLRREA